MKTIYDLIKGSFIVHLINKVKCLLGFHKWYTYMDCGYFYETHETPYCLHCKAEGYYYTTVGYKRSKKEVEEYYKGRE